jgi:sterol desaturase/sphingolipid hydroxylase (fatty acid hydroxylase superfamily)
MPMKSQQNQSYLSDVRAGLANRPAGSQRHRGGRAVLAWVSRLGALLAYGGYVWLLWTFWQALQPHIADDLTVRAAGRAIGAHHMREKLFDSGLWLLVVLPFVLYLEALIVGWPKAALRRILFARNASIRMDIGCILADQAQVLRVLGRLMTFGMSAAAGTWIHDEIARRTGLSVGLGALPYALQVGGYFFIYTFFDYWTHRLDHTKLFWPLHRYHHSTEDFCVITALRQHPAAFTPVLLINMPMAILGAPVDQMILINLIVTLIGLVIHSGIDSDFGWLGQYVIQSPVHHRLHHILDYKKDGVGHYALLPLWDRLFGTWKGDADQSLAIGVDEPYNQGYGFWKDIVRDYADFWSRLIRLATGKPMLPNPSAE